MRQSTTNQWQKGLNLDASSIAMTNQLLAGALNATMVTMNGNEMILQNDMGNARVEDAYLPAGYVPVGMLEFGGIVYVASYNPLTNSSQIGCFPSPERNISSDEVGDTTKEFNSFCQDPISNYVQKLKLTPDVIRPGDKFSIEMVDINLFKELVLLISRGVVIFSVAVIDESGNLIEIKNEDLYKYNYNLSTSEPTILGENPEGTLWKDYYSTPIYLKHGDEVGQEKLRKYSVYKNKLVGDLYLILKLNVPEVAEPLIEGDTLNTDADYYSVLYKTGGEQVAATKPIIGVHFPTYYSAMDGYEAKLFNDAGQKCVVHETLKGITKIPLCRQWVNDKWALAEGLNFYTIDEVYTGNDPDEFANSDKTIWLEPAGDNPAQYVLYDNKCYCKLEDATPIINTWHCEFHNNSEVDGAQDTSVDVTSSTPAYYIDVKNKAGKVVEDHAVEYNYVMYLNKTDFADTDTLTYTITPVISLPMLNGETCTGALKHSSITGTYLLSKIGTDELEILLSYWVDIINNDLYLSFNNLSYLRRDHIITESYLNLRDFVCEKLDPEIPYTKLALALRDRYISYIERLPLIENKTGDTFNITGDSKPETVTGYNFEPYVVKNSIYPDSQVIYKIQSKYSLKANEYIEITSAKTDLITFNPEITLTCSEKVYDLQNTDNTECTIEDNGLYTITYKPKLTLSQYGELQITTNSQAITVTNPIVRADASDLKYLFNTEENSGWTQDSPSPNQINHKLKHEVNVTILGPTFNSCSPKIVPNSFTIPCITYINHSNDHWRVYTHHAIYSDDKCEIQKISEEQIGGSISSATSAAIKKGANFKKGEFYIFGGPTYRIPMMPTWAAINQAGLLILGPIYLVGEEGRFYNDGDVYIWNEETSLKYGSHSPEYSENIGYIQSCIQHWAEAKYITRMRGDKRAYIKLTFIKDARYPKLYKLRLYVDDLDNKAVPFLSLPIREKVTWSPLHEITGYDSYARFSADFLTYLETKLKELESNTKLKFTKSRDRIVIENTTYQDFIKLALEYLLYQLNSQPDVVNNIVANVSCVYLKNLDEYSRVNCTAPTFATPITNGFSTAFWKLVYNCGTGRELQLSYKAQEYNKNDFGKKIEIFDFSGKTLSDTTEVLYVSEHSKALKAALEFSGIQQLSIQEGSIISGTILAGPDKTIPLPNTSIGSKIYYYKSATEHGIPKYLTTNTSGQLLVNPSVQLMTLDASYKVDIMGFGDKPFTRSMGNLGYDKMKEYWKSLPDPYIFWGNIFDYTADE